MDITFAPSFYKLFHKSWHFLRYDIWRFFNNIIKFRKELYHFRSCDWIYPLSMFRHGLELEVDYIEKYGDEIDEIRNKKIEKMKRAIELMKMHEEEIFFEMAEKELGYEPFSLFSDNGLSDEISKKCKNIIVLEQKIENETWDELMEILKGQDYKMFDKNKNWIDQIDGTGLKRWQS